jgi:DinB family protein
MTMESQIGTRPTTRAELLRRVVSDARKILDGTMADVTQAQADYAPPGIANPLGATYAHVVCSEDMVVQGMLRQLPPLFASSWQGRTGLSEPMPVPGPEWVNYAGWTRRVKTDLGALRQYAQAVAAETAAWIASLSEADLDGPVDLSNAGLGQHTLATAIALLIANHLGTETGEISVLKGIQGARGYPM